MRPYKGEIRAFLVCMISMLFLVFAMPVHAQRITEGNYQIETYPEYCNCDKECSMIGGCITKYADPFYININPEKAAKAIADGEKAGYLGACAAATHNGEPIIVKMTPDCDAAQSNAESSAQYEQAQEILLSAENSANKNAAAAASPEAKAINVDFGEQKTDQSGVNDGFIMLAFTSGTIILICLFGLIAWAMYLRHRKNDLSTDDIMNILKKI
ncbi:MAG: hypothetical protein NT001_05005 [Candidatus Woesearchaeota archaeon]|nr:hypothetical protein [Candidatus Woesearchaeota archaeon]